MVLKEGMTVAIAGLTVGLIATVVGVRALEKLLYGVTSHDTVVFMTVPVLLLAVLLLAVMLAAVWLPAERAARVELNAALRGDN